MSPESRVDLRVPREDRKAENRPKQRCEEEVDGCESFINSTVLPTVPDAKAAFNIRLSSSIPHQVCVHTVVPRGRFRR